MSPSMHMLDGSYLTLVPSADLSRNGSVAYGEMTQDNLETACSTCYMSILTPHQQSDRCWSNQVLMTFPAVACILDIEVPLF